MMHHGAVDLTSTVHREEAPSELVVDPRVTERGRRDRRAKFANRRLVLLGP